MKKLLISLVLLFSAIRLSAQGNNFGGNAVLYNAGVPTSCSLNMLIVDTTTTPGTVYWCNAGTPTVIVTGSGTGNVINSGTPLVHQVGVWVDATHIKGIAVGGAGTAMLGNAGADPSFGKITSAQVDNTVALTGTDINTSNQVTATHLAPPLPIAQGGTAGATAAAALINLFPTPTRAGDIAYWNGSAWVLLAGNNSGTKVLQETSGGVLSWVTGGSSARTWRYPFQGVCQGGAASSPVTFDTTNAPSYIPCAAGQLVGEFQTTASTTTNVWYSSFVVPPGVTNSTYAITFKTRTADTTTSDADIITLTYACTTDGTVPTVSGSTFNALTTVTLNPQGTANAIITSTTSSLTMTCAAGNTIIVKYNPSTVAYTINFSYIGWDVQGTL